MRAGSVAAGQRGGAANIRSSGRIRPPDESSPCRSWRELANDMNSAGGVGKKQKNDFNMFAPWLEDVRAFAAEGGLLRRRGPGSGMTCFWMSTAGDDGAPDRGDFTPPADRLAQHRAAGCSDRAVGPAPIAAPRDRCLQRTSSTAFGRWWFARDDSSSPEARRGWTTTTPVLKLRLGRPADCATHRVTAMNRFHRCSRGT